MADVVSFPSPPVPSDLLPAGLFFCLVMSQLESGLDGFAYYLTDPAHLDCVGLTAALEGSGIECPSLDKDLVTVYASTLASGRE